jgi:hypothetical protein
MKKQRERPGFIGCIYIALSMVIFSRNGWSQIGALIPTVPTHQFALAEMISKLLSENPIDWVIDQENQQTVVTGNILFFVNEMSDLQKADFMELLNTGEYLMPNGHPISFRKTTFFSQEYFGNIFISPSSGPLRFTQSDERPMKSMGTKCSNKLLNAREPQKLLETRLP